MYSSIGDQIATSRLPIYRIVTSRLPIGVYTFIFLSLQHANRSAHILDELKVVFGYLNLNLDLNFKVINLKCLDFKSIKF